MVKNDEDIRLVIGDIKSLPTLPSVMARVLEVLRDEKSSASDLEEVIKYDKSLSLKILGFSNAAFYGFHRKITSISDALVVLGFDLVKVLALSLPVFDMPDGDPRMSLFLKRLWSHSCKTALLSGALAADLNINKGDAAFLGGLLSDMGRAAFVHIKGADYLDAIEKAGEGSTAIATERDVLKADHATVSAWIADDFMLPEELVFALKHHHEPTQCPKLGDVAMVVYLADYILSLNNVNSAVDGFKCPEHEDILRRFGLENKKLPNYMNIVMQVNSPAFSGLGSALRA